MEIKAEKSKINKALTQVQRAVGISTPIPILSGIKFTADQEGFLTLTATNLEMTISTVIKVESLQEGSIVLPARYVVDLFKKLPDTTISINADSGKATIIYEKSESSINGFPASDFPGITEIGVSKTFTLSGSLLKTAIRRVSYASSKDNARPVFCGTFFEIEKGILSLVTTDTFRLAIQKINLPGVEDCNFIIPTKALNELERLIEEDFEVKITVSTKQIIFEFGSITFISRLVEGRFPNYKQVVPEKFRTSFTCITKELLEAVDRSLLVSGMDTSPITKISLNGRLTVSAETTSGKILEEIPAEIKGDELSTFLNSRFFLECLKSINDTETVSIGLSGEITPGLVRPLNDESYLSIIVPVKK